MMALVRLLEAFRPTDPVAIREPAGYRVWLSVTSTPKRIGKLPMYLRQFSGMSGIIVNVPMAFRDSESYPIDALLSLQSMPLVKLHRLQHDIGPMCKLVPTVEFLRSRSDSDRVCHRDVVVTVDDDVWYTANAIQHLIDELVKCETVVANKCTSTPAVPRMLQGHWGVAYPLWALPPCVLADMLKCTTFNACSRHDDMCISWALQRHGVPIQTTTLGRSAAWESALGYDSDALSVSGAANDARCGSTLSAKEL